jgi:hypothetical protein
LTLLAKCGFALASKYGSFSGARFNDRAPRLVVVAKAAF